MKRLKEAVAQTVVSGIALAGGVSANSYLRKRFKLYAEESNLQCFIPKFEYCTDNAAMIAIAGFKKYERQEFSSLENEPVARWKIGS